MISMRKWIFGVSKNGYDIQKQHNKQVRDWFQRHHNLVVVQHKQRGRNWLWLTSDEDADGNETKHGGLRVCYNGDVIFLWEKWKIDPL